jgi:purine catabolism regulator
MRSSALVRERGDATLALVSLSARRAPEPRSLVEQLHRAARTATAVPVAIGYGSVRSGTAEVAAAAREAEQALSMGRRLFGPDSATAFKELGLYRLLYALQPLPELRAFRDDALARLRAKDRGGVLLQTLGAYLATNGSPTDAAQRLHLHRNTVLYRLGRLEDLLAVDLRDAEVRLALHLALKIGEVLEP